MRLIDADALVKDGYSLAQKRWDYEEARYRVELTPLADAPTIDAVPVVRCRECKNWFGETDDGMEHSCSVDAWMRPGNWFCPLGQRREDGDA